jgi:hypothetical protein
MSVPQSPPQHLAAEVLAPNIHLLGVELLIFESVVSRSPIAF